MPDAGMSARAATIKHSGVVACRCVEVVNRMSTTQIDTAIDRIKRELRKLEEELALLEAERARRMSARWPSWRREDD